MKKTLKIAVIPGHSKSHQGAKNATLDVSEYLYNLDVCRGVFDKLFFKNYIKPYIFLRPKGKYKTSMEELGKLLKVFKIDIALEFHCNAATNKKATGHEIWIHNKTSPETIEAAGILNKGMGFIFENRNRGVKFADKNSRGYHFLNMPGIRCMILEPGFLSNDAEAQNLVSNQDKYINGIAKYIALMTEVVF